MADVKKVALYYPEIAIPDREWLSQAVLYYDQVGSIVPGALEFWIEQRDKKSATHGAGVRVDTPLVSRDLEQLWKEGEYRPFHPESLVEGYSPESDELVDDFLKALTSERFQRSLGDPRGWVFDADIHVRKGTPKLFDLLVDSNYAKRSLDNEDWISFERSTAHLYMSLLAKHLALGDHEHTVPCTSARGSSFRDIAFRLGDNSAGVCVAEILFRNVLPCPRTGMPMAKVLEFKRRRKDELLRFRREVSDLEDQLSAATTADEIRGVVSDYSDRKNIALADLQKSASDANFHLVLRSMESLVQIRTPVLLLAGTALVGEVTKIADVSLPWFAAGVAGSAAIHVGVTVASGVRRKRHDQQGSAFSYVHHVESELK